jgi:cytoskeletal protein CcmA (bactofilin family)
MISERTPRVDDGETGPLLAGGPSASVAPLDARAVLRAEEPSSMARPQAGRNASASADGDGATIGRGTRVRGRVEGSGDLRIEGEVTGDVRVSGAVTIEGTLTGDVVSEGAVLIRAGAQVEGNMSGAEVALEEGASFSGRIDADFELPDGLEG